MRVWGNTPCSMSALDTDRAFTSCLCDFINSQSTVHVGVDAYAELVGKTVER